MPLGAALPAVFGGLTAGGVATAVGLGTAAAVGTGMVIKNQQEKKAQGAANAAAAKPPAAAPALQPVTPASQLVLTTEQDMRRSALKKKGFASTVLAGDSGGWFGNKNQVPSPQTGPNLPGNKTLGGG